MRPGAIILEYHRRGWLSPGCAAAGVGFARDIAAIAEAPAERLDPAHRLAAKQRLAQVKRLTTNAQLELLEAVARDDHPPATWARINGFDPRAGLIQLRAALRAVRIIYVLDGTD